MTKVFVDETTSDLADWLLVKVMVLVPPIPITASTLALGVPRSQLAPTFQVVEPVAM